MAEILNIKVLLKSASRVSYSLVDLPSVSPGQRLQRAAWIGWRRRPVEGERMIRTILMLVWWAFWTLLNALWGIPWMLLSGNADALYKVAVWGALVGAKIGGAKIEIRGRENIQPGQNYIFMSNHVSNLDPPIVIPLIPGRTSVLVKSELFRIPLLGTAMRLAKLVPVNRTNRDAAIASIREATTVLKAGLHMTVFPRRYALCRRAHAIDEKGAILLSRRIWCSGNPRHHTWIVRNLAEAPFRDALRPGDAYLPFSNHVRAGWQSRSPDDCCEDRN